MTVISSAISLFPSFSIYLTCHSEEEFESLYEKLGKGGQELMPLNDYGFSKKFGWVNDCFGVLWQLNLPF
ncbi:VOC family protein [Mesobacillus maritimus]|uniref:VOC family protein n=1 Tax=Mesobacillus maritimus TaxID=1643336 RepID=UPI00384F87B0